MQHWEDQAKKNGLEIKKKGKCQLCGSTVQFGLTECVDLAGMVIQKLHKSESVKPTSIFLCVDAHALQHAEIHGRWSTHFHLTRLHLILQKNVQWTYAHSPKLSAVLQKHKTLHPKETIIHPNVKQRGVINIKEVDKESTLAEYKKTIHAYATDVYKTFYLGHRVADNIANMFETTFL